MENIHFYWKHISHIWAWTGMGEGLDQIPEYCIDTILGSRNVRTLTFEFFKSMDIKTTEKQVF